MEEKVDLKMLDKIIKDTIKHLEDGKQQIADFAETAQAERKELHNNLQDVKKQTLELIEQVDRLEKEERKARLRLMEVSRDFEKYTEGDIKNAYTQAREIQEQLGALRGEEAQMRIRRDQMEISLRRMDQYVERAESLVSTVGIVLKFMLDNLMGVGIKLEEMQQRQLLGLRVIRAQEEERKRVAREIHDGPAQSMANLVLRSEICEKLLEKNPAEVQQELISLKEMVKNSLQDVRKIIFELRPMVLDDLGIVPALKRYITDFQGKNAINMEFKNTSNTQVRMGDTLEIAVFRIVQEALNNVSRHAQASTVLVQVEQLDSQVNLRIKDDGRGFDYEGAMDMNKSDSYGLLGMRERVELLEGELKVNTAPGQGTDIFVRIPIKESHEREKR